MRSTVVATVFAAVLAVLFLFAAPAIATAWNEIEGSANADQIRGTDAPDRIHGLEGNDVVRGRGGDDRLVGGPGNDVLQGGPGQDTYLCGAGHDVAIVDFARHPERIGDGCEAAILEV
jgi:Ca2+-binding RTX toxin-like protein